MNRQDDPSLTGDLIVYRRIPPDDDRTRWDAEGKPTASSQNFSDRTNEYSVYIARETTPETALQGNDGFGLVQLTIQHFRDAFAEFGNPVIICRDDLEPENGHILICGKATPGIKKRLQKLAVWVPGYWPRRDQPPPSGSQ